MNRVLFSHKSDEWETPQSLFDDLNKEFNFDIDVCATKDNAKCKTYFNSGQNGLVQDWGNSTVWCNPPYSNIRDWAKKCSEHKGTAVLLVPSRTDTKWFHDFCYARGGVEIRFIKGRLKFSNSDNSAPFPSMIVIFKKGRHGKTENTKDD